MVPKNVWGDTYSWTTLVRYVAPSALATCSPAVGLEIARDFVAVKQLSHHNLHRTAAVGFRVARSSAQTLKEELMLYVATWLTD